MSITSVTSLDFLKILQDRSALQILDVRTVAEHENVHLTHKHVLHPIQNFEPNDCNLDKSQPIYIVCAAGIRAQKAADILEQHGFQQLIVVSGGLGRFLENPGAANFVAHGA